MVIDSDLNLQELVARLRESPWIALDTEADSLHAYPEKICLLQVSTPGRDELIDPLSGIDLDPLLDAFSGHELIMHGADYDLRLLRKHHEFVPKAIFDTMLAARLLGQTQFGLTSLVAHYLGVTLEKGSQKADWARRPLTERMEIYARNDTHYLRSLSERLKAELEAKGRLAWHQESCARLILDCSQVRLHDPEMVWRVKGSHHLNRHGLAVAREIWRWREEEATAANRPPYFILRHESIVDLAATAAGGQPFEPLIPRAFPDRRRHSLIKAVRHGLAVPPAEYPAIPRQTSRRVTDGVKRRVQELQQKRDLRATELGIDPTLIASRAELLELAEGRTTPETELMSWQKKLLG